MVNRCDALTALIPPPPLPLFLLTSLHPLSPIRSSSNQDRCQRVYNELCECHSSSSQLSSCIIIVIIIVPSSPCELTSKVARIFTCIIGKWSGLSDERVLGMKGRSRRVGRGKGASSSWPMIPMIITCVVLYPLCIRTRTLSLLSLYSPPSLTYTPSYSYSPPTHLPLSPP